MVIFKMLRELEHNLADAIEVLDEDGGALFFVEVSIILSAPKMKLMAKGDPVFLNKDGQPLDRSVVRVEELLGEGAHLGGSVPAVGAVDQDIRPFLDQRV